MSIPMRMPGESDADFERRLQPLYKAIMNQLTDNETLRIFDSAIRELAVAGKASMQRIYGGETFKWEVVDLEAH